MRPAGLAAAIAGRHHRACCVRTRRPAQWPGSPICRGGRRPAPVMALAVPAQLPRPVLAMLHIAFLWLGIAMRCYSAQSLPAVPRARSAPGAHRCTRSHRFHQRMVWHGLRVTLGHSATRCFADQLTWLALSGSTDRLTASPANTGPACLRLAQPARCSSMAGVFTPWALRYAPLYLRPRATRVRLNFAVPV